MAGALGLSVQPPEQSKETRLREFHKELRKSGLRWVRQPRWSLLRHDLAVIDFKLAVLEAASHPDFTATSWLPESHFRADIDVVSYQFRTRQGRFKNYKKGVCPDAYFEIVVEDRRKTGLQSRAPFLLEMDMATHDNLSFAREKVIPGANYIKSRKYLSRFGTNSGTWLIVTSGNNRRLENLKKQVRENADENVRMFFITSVEHLRSANPLTDPIWFLANNKEPFSLFEGHPRESE